MKSGGHTADLRVDTPQGSRTAGAGVWIPIFDDHIDEAIDLSIREGVPGAVAQSTYRFKRDDPDEAVHIGYKCLSVSVS
jgi:hypothetical protein